MSTTLIICCAGCGSIRVERLGPLPARGFWGQLHRWIAGDVTIGRRGLEGRYRCSACGNLFEVADAGAYAEAHPLQKNRCMACDACRLELVERNHRRAGHPPEEIVDLYRCGACGQELYQLVQEDPGTLYG